LGRGAEKIKLLDIFEALEGEVALLSCLHEDEKSGSSCLQMKTCMVRKGFGFLNVLLVDLFKKYTLSDFINSKWQNQH
jgi:DNA-binding IscR family transcriptional regulator